MLIYCLVIFIWLCDFFFPHSTLELILWHQDIIVPLLTTLYSELRQKKLLYFFVFWIATQPPSFFWGRINIYSISLSIQKKLVFNQKPAIKKKKYSWEKRSFPNEFKPQGLHSRLFETKPVVFDRTIFYCEQQHSQIYTELPFCFEVHTWISLTSESKENLSF